MPSGGGRYDKEITKLSEETQAEMVLLMIMNGKKGSGFSFRTCRPELLHRVPDMLEDIAASIRKDLREVLPKDADGFEYLPCGCHVKNESDGFYYIACSEDCQYLRYVIEETRRQGKPVQVVDVREPKGLPSD